MLPTLFLPWVLLLLSSENKSSWGFCMKIQPLCHSCQYYFLTHGILMTSATRKQSVYFSGRLFYCSIRQIFQLLLFLIIQSMLHCHAVMLMCSVVLPFFVILSSLFLLWPALPIPLTFWVGGSVPLISVFPFIEPVCCFCSFCENALKTKYQEGLASRQYLVLENKSGIHRTTN